MAQRVEVHLIDDLDGKSAADQTVTFGLDGVTYDIDLSDKNAAKLRDVLAPYVGAGRRMGKAPGKGRGGAKAPSSGPKASEVRAWAVENGFEVPERGRIPANVQEAYGMAHAS